MSDDRERDAYEPQWPDGDARPTMVDRDRRPPWFDRDRRDDRDENRPAPGHIS